VEPRIAREQQELVRDETIHLTDALPTTNAKDSSTRSSYHYTLAVWETTVIVTSAANAFTVFLPPVVEAKGKIYCITLVTYGAAAVAVNDLADDSEDFPTISLNASYDRVALYSDGNHWWPICDLFT